MIQVQLSLKNLKIVCTKYCSLQYKNMCNNNFTKKAIFIQLNIFILYVVISLYEISSSKKRNLTEYLFIPFRFKDQIHDVFKMLSADVQVILLSATMPDDVLEVSRCFMRDPVRILVQKEEVCIMLYKHLYFIEI